MHNLTLPVHGGYPQAHEIWGGLPAGAANYFVMCANLCRQVVHPATGTILKLDGSPGDRVCEFAPIPPSSTVRIAKRSRSGGRSHSPSGDPADTTVVSSSSDDDSDPDIPILDLQDLERYPLDIARSCRSAVAGAQTWMGDSHLAPGHLAVVPFGITAASPEVTLKLLSILERVIGLRLMAAVLAAGQVRCQTVAEYLNWYVESTGGTAEDDEVADIADIRWRSIAGPAAPDVFLPPATALESSFVVQVTALGRDGEGLRESLDPKSKADTTIRVRLPNASAFVPWRQKAKGDRCEVVLLAYEALPADPDSGLESIASAQAQSREFRLGMHLLKVGCHPERGCPAAWRAVDEAAIRVRRRIAKTYPDDIASAKAAREKDGARGAADPRRSDVSLKGDGNAKARKTAKWRAKRDAIRGGGGGGGGGGGAAAAVPALTGSAKRVALLAGSPASRSDRDCRAFGFCLKCREPGHMRPACTKSLVPHVP